MLPSRPLSNTPLLLLCLSSLAWGACAAPQRPAPAPPTAAIALSYSNLLVEMVDVSHLARLPQPFYLSGQASSYDRASTAPDKPGWFDNKDSGQFLRVEETTAGKEYVMAELSGAGLLTRIWSANPAGTLRIYLDDNPHPALQVDMKALLSGKVPGIPAPLGHLTAKGYNLYLPIPFTKGCRVTVSEGEKLYYHVGYRLYGEPVVLPTFSQALLEQHAGDIEKVAAVLQGKALVGVGGDVHEASLRNAEPTHRIEAAAGQAAAVTELTLRVHGGSRLGETRLRIHFDGVSAQVDVPLRVFFGTGPEPSAYHSLPFTIQKDGTLVSRWHMPFQQHVTFELVDVPPGVRVQLGARVAETLFDDRSLYFHADHVARVGLGTAEPVDFRFLSTRGPGVYVGNLLHVNNSKEGWWGEGDEKIFVDGEAFPSHFGTGTEDYYGYAWVSPQLFQHAYHNQTRVDGPKNKGHTSVNRFHVADPIPFRERLQFDMEVRHWDKDATLDLEVVNYWYARPGR